MKRMLEVKVTYHDMPNKNTSHVLEMEKSELQHSDEGINYLPEPKWGITQEGTPIEAGDNSFKDQYFASCVKFLCELINDINNIDQLKPEEINQKANTITKEFNKKFCSNSFFNEKFNEKQWRNVILQLFDVKRGGLEQYSSNFYYDKICVLKIQAYNVEQENKKINKLKH